MDYSQQQSLPHFQENQQQALHYHHHQQQDYALHPYEYNPSHLQAYNQSYYSYYQYQHPQQSLQDQHQSYAYYQTDYGSNYANAYQQQDQILQNSQPESVPMHPPGVSIPQEAPPQAVEYGDRSAASAQGGLGHGHFQVQQQQQNPYLTRQVVPAGDPSSLVPSGLNPAAAAAVAALSQLTQFASTMGAAEKAMQGRQWYGKATVHDPVIGGPRLGSNPFMGPGPMCHSLGPIHAPPGGQSPRKVSSRRVGGRGKRPSKSGSVARLHGRGHGRGRGCPRRFPRRGASSSHPEPTSAEVDESAEEAEPSSHDREEGAPTEAATQTNAAPNQQTTRVAWCELCKADCTTLEILEQHKNGKRHKKNLRKLALESSKAPEHVVGNGPKLVVDSRPESTLQPANVHEGEESRDNLQENLLTDSLTDKNKMQSEQQHDMAERPDAVFGEVSNVQIGKSQMNQLHNHRHGLKRKMRGGHGGKRMKSSNTSNRRRPGEPRKPKVVIPVVCDLCNVKCDTQEVFDHHLSGKKHIAKLKRFQGHQAMYGAVGLQAPYSSSPITQSFHPQGSQQSVHGPQGAYILPQVHHVAIDAGSGSGFQQSFDPQISYTTPEFGDGETKTQQQTA